MGGQACCSREEGKIQKRKEGAWWGKSKNAAENRTQEMPKLFGCIFLDVTGVTECDDPV